MKSETQSTSTAVDKKPTPPAMPTDLNEFISELVTKQEQQQPQLLKDNKLAQRKMQNIKKSLLAKDPVVDFSVKQPIEQRESTPLPEEPILPKQKKKQRDKGLPKQSKRKPKKPSTPPLPAMSSFNNDRATPPLEDLINKRDFKSINAVDSTVPSTILFPQVVSGDILTSAHIAVTDSATIASAQMSPKKEVVFFIDRGINPVTVLSPERPNPKSLKEWNARLQFKELDDFAANIIMKMKMVSTE